jgi:ferredoxin, 2Fe-2S
MPKITFTEANGIVHVVDAPLGKTLMQVAVDNLIPGILGDCGGSCSCATCHAYIDPAWQGRLPPPGEDETFMLEGALDVRDNSRLCCQLDVREEWDGLLVEIPAEQF